jgi:hypothetical protein
MLSFEELLKRHNIIPFKVNGDDNTNEVPEYLIQAFQHELSVFGYISSSKLVGRLSKLSLTRFDSITKDTLKSLKSILGVKVHKPLYPNFPSMKTTEYDDDFKKTILKLVSNNNLETGEYDYENSFLLGCGHLINRNDWEMSFYDTCPICGVKDVSENFAKLKEKPSFSDIIKLKVLDYKDISVLAESDILSLLSRTTIMSETDMIYLMSLKNDFTIFDSIATSIEDIPVKETSTIISVLLYEKGIRLSDIKFIKTSTDILRFIVSYSGGDISLIEDVRIAKLNRPIRKQIIEALNNFKETSLVEDLLRYKSLWKHIGKALHVFEYKNKYVRVASAFQILRESNITKTNIPILKGSSYSVNNDKNIFRNFYGQIDNYVKENDLHSLLKVVSSRPSEFARKMDMILARFDDHTSINNSFKNVVDKIPSNILVSLINNLNTRKIVIPNRIVSTKKKTHTKPETRKPITNPDLEEIIKNSLRNRMFNDGNTLIDHSLKNIVMPLSERNVSKQLVVIPKGSRIPIHENNIRFFLHWVEKDVYTDLDLSVIMYDENFVMKDYCDFTKTSIMKGIVKHSGDYTSAPAPHGASEFVDIDLDGVEKKDIRYIATELYSYSNTDFEELDEAFMGYMGLDDLSSDAFEPKAVKDRFDISGSALVKLSYLIDVKERCIYCVDTNRHDRIKSACVDNSNDSLSTFLPTFLHTYINKTSVFDIAEYHTIPENTYLYIDGKVYNTKQEEVDISNISFKQAYLLRDDLPNLTAETVYSLYKTSDRNYIELSKLL